MESFLLTLSNGALLSGLACIPRNGTSSTLQYRPLIVAVHGATYSSKYFDATPEMSASKFSEQMGVPFVAIDRPGYKESSALPAIPSDSTFFQEEGKYIHRFVLPKIWEQYGRKSGASTIVLLGHSLGVSACVIAPVFHSQDTDAGYPLGGTMLSGRSVTSALSKAEGERQLAETKKLGYLTYPPEVKDFVMLGDQKLGLASDDLRRISEEISQRGSVGEIEDRRLYWDGYWSEYAKQVKVPVMAAIGERDGLFQASHKDIADFTKEFTSSPKVETALIRGAPHCIELSHWGPGWYSRCFGFAMECAVSAALA